ncbi:MAG: vanadium-dependent haloperoxidase [Polaribacter sp.]|nr:vanadium-dependent haloperoxidase [Polaribacter sp.]
MLKIKKNLFGFIFMFLLASCSDDNDSRIMQPELISPANYNSDVVVSWFNLIKVLTTETAGYTPPVAARAFGYTGVALYESLQVGAKNKQSLSGTLNALNLESEFEEGIEYHWPTVANTVLATMTKFFYSNASIANYSRILELETEFNNQYSDDIFGEVLNRSIIFANDLAEQIVLWSTTDGGYNAQFNNFPIEYEPLPGIEFWKPTALNQRALQPYWGNNRPFISLNLENCIPINPPVYSTDVNSVYYARALEVYEVVNNVTPQQTVIAEFWSDDPQTSATPPGHSISILNQLINDNNFDLLASSEAFAQLAIGINDSFISCWKVKYATNYPRPVTVINNQIDASWETILETPPFPEYTSGHSVQSGALAAILTSLFGDNYAFIDRTHENRTDIDGTPREYSSFFHMAEEAAESRLYGGIHYREAIDLGLEQGYQIGENVINIFNN